MNKIIDYLINNLNSQQKTSYIKNTHADMQERSTAPRPAFPGRDGNTSRVNRTSPPTGPKTSEN